MPVDELSLLIRAGNPIVSMATPDEPRAVDAVTAVAEQMRRPIVQWSITEGLFRMTTEGREKLVEPGKPAAALAAVARAGPPTIYLFKDLGPHCKDPQVARQLRDLYFTPDDRPWSLVLIDAVELPPDVRRLTVPFRVGWPDERELELVVRNTFRQVKERNLVEVEARLTAREMEQLVNTLRGLTVEEASRIVAAAIHEDNVLDAGDLPRIVDAKRQRLEAVGCLEAIAPDVAPDDIGGLASLKRWLNLRRGAMTTKAREYGLDPPRGMLLLGVQGCGKSLCAKVVASAWRMPLLRMDPGVLYQKFIGESEARLRDALRQAESMAPVVLWIDEIEKAFASAGVDSADGGLSQRMFGTLLSWMQDHRHPIFLIATANNIAQLPPELMRKGRFDEVFFVDLPGPQERETIFAVHLRKRRRDKQRFDLARLAAATDRFTGAEIEQAVVAGMYAAFAEGVEVTTEHILAAAASTQPLAVVMRESVEQLRAWAKDRCVPAD